MLALCFECSTWLPKYASNLNNLASVCWIRPICDESNVIIHSVEITSKYSNFLRENRFYSLGFLVVQWILFNGSSFQTHGLWTLEKSCDKLPCSIILVLTENGKEEVIGHSRVVEAQGADNACYVETVVVKSDLRGRGFGRRLMEESEKFASCKGYKQMFLNTIDKEKFYSHLGYTESHPVITLGANASKLPQHMIDKLTQTTTRCTPCTPTHPPPTATALPPPSNTVAAPLHPNPNGFTTVAPPPPPPLPPTSKKCQPTEGCNTHVMELCCDPSKVTWMRKDLIPKVFS